MHIIAIYKELGKSSFKALSEVKKFFNTKKVGHLGTLDPLAEGVLVVAVDEATKLIPYMITDPKEYIVEIFFGFTTKTLDAEGIDKELVFEQAKKVQFNEEKLQEGLEYCKNLEIQIPPIFSALKINGVRAYDLARSGKLVETDMKPRKVSLFEYELLEFALPIVKVRLVTSGGYYVRSFVRDLASYLEEEAFMYSLIRSKVGVFGIDDCSVLSENKLHEKLLGPEILKNYLEITVDSEQNKDLRNGKKVLIDNYLDCSGRLAYVKYDQRLISIAQIEVENNKAYLIPLKNFNS